MKLNTFLLCSAICFLSTTVAFAQSVGVVCINASTKAVSVEKKCAKGTTQLTAAGLAGALNFSKCYSQTGKASGALPSGKVAVALSCKNGDIMIADGFDAGNDNRAFPKLSSKEILFNAGGKTPVGVQLETIGEPNVFYTIYAKIQCCPVS